MTGIPQEAIDAASRAYASIGRIPAIWNAGGEPSPMQAAVEAAAPHIAAAERERIRQLAIGHDATAWPDEGTQRIPFADLLGHPQP